MCVCVVYRPEIKIKKLLWIPLSSLCLRCWLIPSWALYSILCAYFCSMWLLFCLMVFKGLTMMTYMLARMYVTKCFFVDMEMWFSPSFSIWTSCHLQLSCSMSKIKILDASGPPGLPSLLGGALEMAVTTAITALSFSPDGEVPLIDILWTLFSFARLSLIVWDMHTRLGSNQDLFDCDTPIKTPY